jgi:hypothetical protein
VFGGESLSNFYKKFNAIKMKLLQGSLSGIWMVSELFNILQKILVCWVRFIFIWYYLVNCGVITMSEIKYFYNIPLLLKNL